MKIKSIKLTNFRNWDNKELTFSDRVLIYGPNAQGKTNILESLYLVATTRSFRGKEAQIIKKDEEFTRVLANIETDREIEVDVVIKKTENSIDKEFKINEKKKNSIDFVGTFSAIIFSPEDINVITGPPEGKRRYLSFTLGQKDREYLFDLLNYKKTLRHRNELLKRADRGTINEEIDIWDQNLSNYGEEIIAKRRALEEFINERFSGYYEELSGENHELKFVYEPELWGENLKESLLNSREKDIHAKTTTVGPHRDSWSIFIDGMDATQFCSRGELRTVILALKMTERDFFLTKDPNPPVILLDDVFSELDASRRRYLLNAFTGSQLIITTTDLDHLDESFRETTQLVNIAEENLNTKNQISNEGLIDNLKVYN